MSISSKPINPNQPKTPSNIPRYIKSFEKINTDDDEKLKKKLIEAFKKGGINVDDFILSKVSAAKPSVIYVANKNKSMIKNGKTVLGNEDYRQGKWLYCGLGYYVRCIDNKYEFAKYAKYDTSIKKIVGDWDDKENVSNA